MFARRVIMMLTLVLLAAQEGQVNAQIARGDTSYLNQIEQQQWNRGYHGMALICRSMGMQVHETEQAWKRVPRDERILIVLGDYVPSQMGMSSLVGSGGGLLLACDGDGSAAVSLTRFTFHGGKGSTIQLANAYLRQFPDCPVVTLTDVNHPTTKGIDRIITNRPATVRIPRGRSSRFLSVAKLPRTIEILDGETLVIASKDDSARRALICADPSIFTNQMLTLGDNAQFTLQTLQWLKGERRTNVLFVIDGYVVAPPDPATMNIEIPPFSPKDVLDALKYLPKDKLLEVGNSVATMVEDENLPNEILASAAKDVLPIKYQRALIFIATGLLGAFLLFRYLTSESLLQDALGIGKNPDKLRRVDTKNRHQSERKAAAMELVSRFYEDVTEGERTDAEEFPAGVKISKGKRADWKEMKRVGKQMRKKASWWTASRLQRLAARLEYWSDLKQSDELIGGPKT